MSNTHKGVILEIRDTKQVTEKFQKRQFVVDQVFTGQYGESHSPAVFSLVQEKCGLIDQFSVGDKVIVHFDLDFRPWIKDGVHQLDREGEKAYFADVKAWKIEPFVENQQAQAQSAPGAPLEDQGFAQTAPSSGPVDDDFDPTNDLPF